MLLTRETIIALRARHTAFRIAVEILYPPQPPPPPTELPIPIAEDAERARAEWEAFERARAAAEQRSARSLRRLIIVLFAALLLLMVIAVWDAMNRPAPPPVPQGRPIPEMPRY